MREQCQAERVKEMEFKKMAEEKNSHLSGSGKSTKVWKVVGGQGTRCLALREKISPQKQSYIYIYAVLIHIK